MKDDLAKRLRNFANGCRRSMWQSRYTTIALMDEAAASIAALEAENARLREVMVPMHGLVAYVTGLPDGQRWTPEFTHYVNGRFNYIAALENDHE